MKVRVIKDFKPQNGVGWIRANEVFECRRVPMGVLTWVYQIIEGNHSGVLIDSLHCVELPKERTYSESEYKLVREERDLLLRQIEKEKSEQQKPVVIPLEVADAIVLLRSYGYSNYTIIDSALRGYSQVKALDTWATPTTVNTLISALINGYTVETLESKIKAGVEKIYHEWAMAALDNQWDMATEQEEISKRIADFVTQIIREDQTATQQQ